MYKLVIGRNINSDYATAYGTIETHTAQSIRPLLRTLIEVGGYDASITEWYYITRPDGKVIYETIN